MSLLNADIQRQVWHPWTVGEVSDENYAYFMTLPGYDLDLDVVGVAPVTRGAGVGTRTEYVKGAALTPAAVLEQLERTLGVPAGGPTADGRMKPDLVAPGERILSASEEKGAWTTPKEVPFLGSFRSGDPCLSPDGQRLFYSSSRDARNQPMEDRDLWYVQRAGTSILSWQLGLPLLELSKVILPSILAISLPPSMSTRPTAFGLLTHS